LSLPEFTVAEVVPFSVAKVEELCKTKEIQMWFAFQDDPNDGSPGRHSGYDRYAEGTPAKAYEAVSKLQSRLEGERKRGRRVCLYDEILITEALNNPRETRVLKPVVIGTNVLTAFADDFLESMTRFFLAAPGSYQADIQEGRGIVCDFEEKLRDPALKGETPLPELPALRRLRVGVPAEDRRKMAVKNRNRQKALERGLLCLMRVPSAPVLLNGSGGANEALMNTGFSLASLDDTNPALMNSSGGMSKLMNSSNGMSTIMNNSNGMSTLMNSSNTKSFKSDS